MRRDGLPGKMLHTPDGTRLVMYRTNLNVENPRRRNACIFQNFDMFFSSESEDMVPCLTGTR